MAPPREPALVPSQAVQLTALGILAEGPRRYADLAREVADFADRILGKSLDLMGTSLELMRYEGLIEAQDAAGMSMVDNAEMRLTEAGHRALRDLLRAPLRAPSSELSRLMLALKLRFLPLLDPADREQQRAVVRDWYAGEIARLEELRALHADHSPLFDRWLDGEIGLMRRQVAEIAGSGE